MNILIIDDPATAGALKADLKTHLGSSQIKVATPGIMETPELFARRILKDLLDELDDKDSVIVVNANLRCNSRYRKSYSGLDVLEYLLAEKPIPAVVLSFLENPSQYSSDQRLKNDTGEILLSHPTILYERLPIDTKVLATLKIKLALTSKIEQERTVTFRSAFYRQMAAAIRHRNKNLRAALRMLDGVARLNLMTSDHYFQVIETLRKYHPTASTDLEILQHDLEWLPLPGSVTTRFGAGKKVLLVDDEAERCAWGEILKCLCQSVGADLQSVTSLDLGIERLSTEVPDVVLLDLHYLNTDEPPDPFEVLTRAREASPFVPIIIFTTEQEGRYVRDLGKEAFYYFFKEMDEKPGTDTRMYAEAFRNVLDSATETSLPVLLRGLVRLSVQSIKGGKFEFDRARDMLEYAASTVFRPEVALSLVTGALLESRSTLADSQRTALTGSSWVATWAHLIGLFERESADLPGLRKKLPEIVKAYRNYASHYEKITEPKPTVFDAVIYLLLVTQFIADLCVIANRSSLGPIRENLRNQLLSALGRISQEMGALIKTPRVLESELLDKLQNLIIHPQQDLSRTFEAKCAQLVATNQSPFSETGPDVPAFRNILGSWFGSNPVDSPKIDWQRGQHVAPYLLYVCGCIMLERITQIDLSLPATE